jgi:hypothetical protein
VKLSIDGEPINFLDDEIDPHQPEHLGSFTASEEMVSIQLYPLMTFQKYNRKQMKLKGEIIRIQNDNKA